MRNFAKINRQTNGFFGVNSTRFRTDERYNGINDGNLEQFDKRKIGNVIQFAKSVTPCRW